MVGFLILVMVRGGGGELISSLGRYEATQDKRNGIKCNCLFTSC